MLGGWWLCSCRVRVQIARYHHLVQILPRPLYPLPVQSVDGEARHIEIKSGHFTLNKADSEGGAVRVVVKADLKGCSEPSCCSAVQSYGYMGSKVGRVSTVVVLTVVKESSAIQRSSGSR